MSALQSLYGHCHCDVLLVGLHFLVVQGCCDVHTSGAADDQLSFVLRVEVEKDFACEHARLQAVCSYHVGLLIGGDESLQRTVLQCLVLHDGHDGSHADTVVGTEGRTLCLHPFAVNPCLDWVVLEVVYHLWILLRHHVHVCLEDSRLAVFHSRCGRLAHDYVSGFVHECLYAYALCKLEQEFLHFLQIT